jgi:alpha-mannosidase
MRHYSLKNNCFQCSLTKPARLWFMPQSLINLIVKTSHDPGKKLRRGVILGLCLSGTVAMARPKAWFVDGYHGGIYGHYPPSFTQFIVDSMRANPNWKLNLEIEPATWDFVSNNTPEAYAAFKKLVADQSVSGRIEFINPAYAQSYLWNISGESVIQQFARGMEKIREHFPNAQFTTYSCEEPCFTSALPGILKSFGFKYAVLKNPDTCWGGYARSFGGELVNWIGPDGTAIPTVPRYAMESLNLNSTWETIANDNSSDFVQSAFKAGIKHPVGMCIQDAGWRNGPWLKPGGDAYEPTDYTTWRNYFQNVAIKKPAEDLHFSQEDVRVSLVWGAQVLQRIAQEARHGESRVVMAEKMATLAGVYRHATWPEASLDEAWRTLMLSQHHDCWIVPYNVRGTNTWADKAASWTGNTIRRSDKIIRQSAEVLAGESNSNAPLQLRVFNTLGVARTDIARVTLPEDWQGEPLVRDSAGKEVPSQVVTTDGGGNELIFLAGVPAMGYATFRLDSTTKVNHPPPLAFVVKNGRTVLETDLYRLELDPVCGGTISSLVLKKQGERQLVDAASTRRFNELRGFFWRTGKFFSTADHPAQIEIIENGPVQARVRIDCQIASNAVTQVITLTQGQRRIDFSVRIEWQGSPGIGENFEQSGGFQFKHDHKAFYDDRYKLLALFPANLGEQQFYKNNPFDVTHSRLANTFFNTWSGIKNNVLLNWVDEFDPTNQVGLALLSDHTTSYTHGTHYPLGLTLQYSGIGLWGRDYSLRGPTEVNYALVPHAGNWEQAALWAEDDGWNEPLQTEFCRSETAPTVARRSLLSFDRDGWEVPTMRLENGKVYIRLFNASQEAAQRKLTYDGPVAKVELVQLNDELLREIPVTKDAAGRVHFELKLPRFGVATLRITP